MPEPRRLQQTKIKASWPCSEEGCETLIQPGDICYRVLDEKRGFPLICGTCSGSFPGEGPPVCAGCLEPITKTADDDFTWTHSDGEALRWRVVACSCNHGQTWQGDVCAVCLGTGRRRSLDHEARPINRKEEP